MVSTLAHPAGLSGLGEFMAVKEAKTLIAMIAQRYRFVIDASHPVDGYVGVTMPALKGVMMTVKRK